MIWMEKSIITNSFYRQDARFNLGVGLLSPERAEGHRDVYRMMRRVEPNDLVLHLIDNKAIVGVSRVLEKATVVSLKSSTWYYAPLTSFRDLDPVLPRSVFLNSPFIARLIDCAGRKSERSGPLFFTVKGTLHQGAYLTELPLAVFQVLEDAYTFHSGKPLLLEHERSDINADTISRVPT